MTALVLVFCLQSAPNSCIEQRPAETLTPAACLMQAQLYAANSAGRPSQMALVAVAVRNQSAAPAAGVSGVAHPGRNRR